MTQLNGNSKEPALAVGVSVATVAGVVSLISTVFPNLLSDDIKSLIIVLGSFILPIITAIFTRGRVWSPSSVKELVNEAVKEAEEAIRLNKPNGGF